MPDGIVSKLLPRPFAEFYEDRKKLLEQRRRDAETSALKRRLASEERVLQLQDEVARGRETKTFIEGAFWQYHLEPLLRSEAVLKPAAVKDGDPAPSERAFQDFLIGSGQVRVLTRVIDKMNEWMQRGEEARKILEVESERRQKLKDLEARGA